MADPSGDHDHRDHDHDDDPFPFDEDGDEDDGADECGRWRNGRLVDQCLKAGSEECDWDCPIGLPGRPGR